MTRSLRIVVADDEPDVREYFLRLLPRMGHTVVAAAANGIELVQLCQLHEPDLIIADVRMPGLTGQEAVRTICQRLPTPFILISAFHADLEDQTWGDAKGLYLDKPVTKQQLANAIQQLAEELNNEPNT